MPSPTKPEMAAHGRSRLGDDGDTVGPLQGVVDDHIFLAPVDDVPVGGSQTVQQLVGEVFGIVDEFLHFHGEVLLIMI